MTCKTKLKRAVQLTKINCYTPLLFCHCSPVLFVLAIMENSCDQPANMDHLRLGESRHNPVFQSEAKRPPNLLRVDCLCDARGSGGSHDLLFRCSSSVVL